MAKIIENPKLTDASKSILYRSVRERFDSECANERDEFARMTMEALADFVGEIVRADSEKCKLCLSGDKTLSGLYGAMQEKAKEICKPAPGKLTSYAMPPSVTLGVVNKYFGFKVQRFGEVLEFETDFGNFEPKQKDVKEAKESDAPVSLFDLI